jgi:hypothetical protein
MSELEAQEAQAQQAMAAERAKGQKALEAERAKGQQALEAQTAAHKAAMDGKQSEMDDLQSKFEDLMAQLAAARQRKVRFMNLNTPWHACDNNGCWGSGVATFIQSATACAANLATHPSHPQVAFWQFCQDVRSPGLLADCASCCLAICACCCCQAH